MATNNNSYEEEERQKHFQENHRRFKAWSAAKKARSLKKNSAVVIVDDPPQRKDSRQLYKVATNEEGGYTLNLAMSLQGRLESDGHLCFFKLMTRSQVYEGAWMTVPSEFSNKYLGKKTFDVWLEDEESKEYKTNYIGTRNGLSGGWGTFALKHKLHEGDVLVFQLIDETRFKVHIIRGSNNPGEGNAENLKKDGETISHSDVVVADNSEEEKTRILARKTKVSTLRRLQPGRTSKKLAEQRIQEELSKERRREAGNNKEEKAKNPAIETKGSTSPKLQPGRSTKLAQPRKRQREAAEPEKPVQKRKMEEKLFRKKPFYLSQVTQFSQVIKNLVRKRSQGQE